MKFLLVFFTVFSLQAHSLELKRGEIISARVLEETVCDASNTLEGWAVRYVTLDLNGVATQASGFVSFPKKFEGSLPIVSYQHGTVIDREQVPSRGFSKGLSCLFGKGAMISAPDYLGMGDSAGFHPYIHAKTESSASLDLLRAATTLAKLNKRHLNGKLYLTGYSQGGHATMALFQELSTTQTEFTVTATAALAGPYDLSGTTLRATLSNGDEYNSSLYTAFILAAYDKLYPKEKFIELALSKFKAFVNAFVIHDLTLISKQTPKFPQEMFSPEVLKDLLENDNHPFLKALKENNVYEFLPSAPTLFCYGGADKSVSPENAKVAERHMKALGGDVQSVNVGDTLTHATAGSACHGEALKFFLTH